jgi:hypothetical protein
MLYLHCILLLTGKQAYRLRRTGIFVCHLASKGALVHLVDSGRHLDVYGNLVHIFDATVMPVMYG